MEMKKIIMIFAAIIFGTIMLVSARNLVQAGNINTNPDNDADSLYQKAILKNTGQDSGEMTQIKDGIQNIKLSMDEKGDYYLQPSILIKGIPVKMEVDLNSVVGCARSIVIPSFNVLKNVRKGDNIIEFTPDKTGEFTIHCSMNMYHGAFTVVDENGEKSDFVEANPANTVSSQQINKGSCGMAAGGGCGCGGRF